jgi:hypothetical protein
MVGVLMLDAQAVSAKAVAAASVDWISMDNSSIWVARKNATAKKAGQMPNDNVAGDDRQPGLLQHRRCGYAGGVGSGFKKPFKSKGFRSI